MVLQIYTCDFFLGISFLSVLFKKKINIYVDFAFAFDMHFSSLIYCTNSPNYHYTHSHMHYTYTVLVSFSFCPFIVKRKRIDK